MKTFRTGCTCGATISLTADELTIRGAENLWRAMHGGPDHAEDDYMGAVQTRVRNEKDRLKAQMANGKQGST